MIRLQIITAGGAQLTHVTWPHLRHAAAAAASSKMSNHVMAIGAGAAAAGRGSSTLRPSLSLFLVIHFVLCCMHVHAAAGAAASWSTPLCARAHSIAAMDKINWTKARARMRGDYPHEGESNLGLFRLTNWMQAG